MLDYDDEIMDDGDWLYEEDEPKKKVNKQFNTMPKSEEKIQPPEWTQKGCVTIDDPAEKERLRKELEKKEKKKQQNREYQKRWYEKKKAEKEAAKKKDEEKKDKPKMTFADVAEELKQMEESAIDDSLDRLAKLRELAETEQAETTEIEPVTTEIENTTTEETTEIVEPVVLDQEEPAAVTVHKTQKTEELTINLTLTSSEAESLYMFIKDELLTVVKRDDVEELDWLADMCSIYSHLKRELIR